MWKKFNISKNIISLILLIVCMHFYYVSNRNLIPLNSTKIGWFEGTAMKVRTDGLGSNSLFTSVYANKKSKKRDHKKNKVYYKKDNVPYEFVEEEYYLSAIRLPINFFVAIDYVLYKLNLGQDNRKMLQRISIFLVAIAIFFLFRFLQKEFGLGSVVISYILLMLLLERFIKMPYNLGGGAFLYLLHVSVLFLFINASKWKYILINCLFVFLLACKSYDTMPIVLVSGTLPLIYKMILDKKADFIQFLIVSASSIISFLMVLLLHFMLLSNHLNSSAEAYKYMKLSLIKRTHKIDDVDFKYFDENFRMTPSKRVENSHKKSFKSVFKKHTKQYRLVGEYSNKSVFYLIFILTIISGLLYWKGIFKLNILSFGIITLLSFLSVIINLYIFKSHAVIHDMYQWWVLPTLIFALIFIGTFINGLGTFVYHKLKESKYGVLTT